MPPIIRRHVAALDNVIGNGRRQRAAVVTSHGHVSRIKINRKVCPTQEGGGMRGRSRGRDVAISAVPRDRANSALSYI